MPSLVDERYDVPLPAQCPTCAGPVVETAVTTQYQEELPVTRTVVRQFAPIVTPTTTTFGQVTASNQSNYARRAQLGVKITF